MAQVIVYGTNGERPNINLNVTEKNPNSPRELGMNR